MIKKEICSILMASTMGILTIVSLLVLVVLGILLLAWVIIFTKRHNKQIIKANQKYESLINNINGGMLIITHSLIAEQTLVEYVSDGFTKMTGYTLEDIKTKFQGKYLNIVFEKDRMDAFNNHLKKIQSGNTYGISYRIVKKDGSCIWVMDNGYLIKDEEGVRNQSILTDISELKNQEEELRLSENRFSVAINASSGTLFEVDLKKQLYTHFENSERIFGVSSERLLADTLPFSLLTYDEFVQATTTHFFHPDDRDTANMAMAHLVEHTTASYEARLRRYDGAYIWARIDLRLILDEFGAPAFLVGFMSDIDSVKKQAEQLKTQVQTDPMTGLYNKVAMETLSNKALNEYPNGLHALIILDIDNFKGINDTLGHAFGDVVLIEVCNKLKGLFRSNDVVGRVGGDEFAIFMKNVPDISGVLKKATELSTAFRQTYVGEKNNYKISCSMGIIMIESKAEKFEALYRKADAALYQAKQNGKDQFVLYKNKDSLQYPVLSTRTNDEELHNIIVSHNIEAHIFELLYASKDFNISINMAIAAIGQQYHVSRVAIFENNDSEQTTSNIYEWCNDGVSAENSRLKDLKISSGKESIADSFDSNGLLYCSDVNELRPYLRSIMQSKGTLSTLQVTIVNDGKIYGYIGFDECKENRIWTAEEIEKLSYLSKLLSVFLFKKKTEHILMENLNTRIQILDILPDYICVVNPKTHAIEYTNKKMRVLIPNASSGAFCFTTLRGGQKDICKECLIERIKRGDTDNLEIVSEDKKIRLDVNAISINWSNNQKMVLLYGIEKQQNTL